MVTAFGKSQVRLEAEFLLEYELKEDCRYKTTEELVKIVENDLDLRILFLKNNISIRNDYFTKITKRTNTIENELKSLEVLQHITKMANDLGYNEVFITGSGFRFEKVKNDGTLEKFIYNTCANDIKKEYRSFLRNDYFETGIDFKELPLLSLTVDYINCIHKNGKVMDRVQDIELPKIKEN